MAGATRERLSGAGYRAGWSLVRTMPAGLSERTFRAAADAATIRNGRGVRQLRRNLRRVVGPRVSELRMDALVGEALRSYARYWRETFRLERMDHTRVAACTTPNSTGAKHLDEGLSRGKGVILALPHTGNWDAAGIWLVQNHGPFTTVAERLRPASVFDRFVTYRESLGMEVVALTGGEPPAGILAERLRGNGVVCLLADRDLSGKGMDVSLFGEPARLPPGPALLAATTGATLIVVSSFFAGPDAWGLDFSAPIVLPAGRLRSRVAAGTQAMADLFAQRIAKRPADWHMLQPLWTADR